MKSGNLHTTEVILHHTSQDAHPLQARKGQQFGERAKKLRKAENLEPIQNLGTLGTWESGIVSEY